MATVSKQENNINLNNKMNKNLILTAALMLSASGAMAQSGTFQLKANLKNFGDTVLVWKGRGAKMDTVLVKKDKFTYTTTMDKPANYYFASPDALRGKSRTQWQLVCVPGEKAELKGDIKSRFDITGSQFYQQYHQLDMMKEATQKKATALSDSLNNLMKNGAKQEDVYKIYSEKMPAILKEQNEKFFAYIAQHANEEASAALVTEFESPEDMEKAKNLLSESVRNGRMKALYEPIFEQIKKQNSPTLVGAKIRRSYFKSLRRISRRVSRPMQRRKKPKSTRRQTKDSCAPTKSVRRCRLHCDRYSRICYIGRRKMLACAKNGELMSSMSSDCIDLSCDKRHNAWSKTARFMRSTTFFT